jgi:hypothetical protein
MSALVGGTWQRHGGWSGIVFVTVWAVGFVVRGDTPWYDDSTADIRRYWQDSGDRYIVVQYVVLLAAVLLFLPYALALTEHLGRAEGEPRLWSRVSLLGAVLLVAFALGAGAAWGAMAFAIDDLSDQEVRLLMTLDVGAFQTEGFAIGLFVLAASLVAVGTAALRRWVGILGLVSGVGLLLWPMGLLPDDLNNVFNLVGFLAFLLALVWVVSTSVALLRSREPVLT